MFTSTSVIYTVIYLILIVGFSYFYATIQYNPVEVANNLKKNGGFIPGFRPGRPTADFIRKVINKVTLFGAIYLGIIAVLPVLLGTIMSNTRFSFGGTSHHHRGQRCSGDCRSHRGTDADAQLLRLPREITGGWT